MFNFLFLSVIFISQLFGLFPISGLNSRDPKHIKFQWKSLSSLFSMFFVLISIFASFLVLYRLCQSGPLTPSTIVGFIFYFNCFLACAFFFEFALRFSDIMERWILVEKSIYKSNLNRNVGRWSLKKRIYVCVITALSAALIEHLLSLASATQGIVHEFKICNWTDVDFAERFISKHFDFVFSVVEYSHFKGFLAEYFNISFTFYWSFVDIFIMVVSIGISFYFENINNKIEFFRERAVPDSVWAEVRCNYNEVSELLKYVDRIMDKTILLACCNDTYFILVQLLNVSS